MILVVDTSSAKDARAAWSPLPEQFREVFDRADDTARVPLERRFAPADESRLIRDDFYEHPVPHPGVADERIDSLNFHPQKFYETSGAS